MIGPPTPKPHCLRQSVGLVLDGGRSAGRGVEGGQLGERVLCAPVVVAVVEVELPVKLVGAALGDGVDDSAGGAAVFGGVDAGVDLELLYRDLRRGIALSGAAALLGEVGLVVIGAVDL